MKSDDMKVSKGLGFPVVALPGVGHMPAKGEDEQEVARVCYVGPTRASQRQVIGVSGDGVLGTRLHLHSINGEIPNRVLRQFHCDFSLAAGQSSDSIFPA